MASFAKMRDDALGFAEGVGADAMCTVWKLGEACEQLVDFACCIWMTEDRQAKGCFRDKNVSVLNNFELSACWVAAAFIIACEGHAQAAIFNNDLCGPENMTCGRKPDGHAIDVDCCAKGKSLLARGAVLTIAGLHDGKCVWCCENMAVAAPRMI